MTTTVDDAENDPETARLGDPLNRAYTWDDFPHPLRAHDVPALIAKDIG
jgi:hypothetical protein